MSFVGKFIYIEKLNPCMSCCPLNLCPLFRLSTNGGFYCIQNSVRQEELNWDKSITILEGKSSACHASGHVDSPVSFVSPCVV